MHSFKTIADIKQANEANGMFFFSKDTMRFFASKVYPTVYGGRFFVTSEKSSFDNLARQYRVREADEGGNIFTDDRIFATLEAARTYAKAKAQR